jgi:hypothetical protein
MGAGSQAREWLRGAALAAALTLLNASLTFNSVWPTLWVRPTARVSLDATALVLGLVLLRWWRRGPLSRVVLAVTTVLWAALAVARYVEVTTRALYGRSVNLYWDLALLPDVGAMFAAVAEPRVLLVLAAVLIVLPLLLYIPLRWAVGTVHRATASAAWASALAIGSCALLLAGGAARTAGYDVVAPLISASIAQEVAEFARDVRASHAPLPAAPSLDNDLGRVRGADVVVLFVESYGVTSWERPEFVATLAPARERLSGAIAETNRGLVSARIESTTFGGESWLAHISLLSGVPVRDQATNRRLMSERRDTLVTTFGRAGYRTFGVFPGLHGPWPEGRFYGFDRIVTGPDLRYAGPPFGWWDLTDQFVLARVDELVAADGGTSPRFVFLPTISTHTPFTPVPPYQPDWARVVTATPYDEDDLQRAYLATPDWTDLGPAYASAVAYFHDTLGGYLRKAAGRDLVLVVLGDHQPPALVSGEGASWHVPVHVIASRGAVLDRLRARGFRDGLEPSADALARMDTLLPILLDAFGH